MKTDTSVPVNDHITFFTFLRGFLPVLVRFPSILANLIKFGKTTKSNNYESWGSMLEHTAKKYPDRPAIKFENSIISYRDYNELVNQYVYCMVDLGVKKGDCVVLFAENRIEYLTIYSAVAKIGAATSVININLRGEALAHCINLNKGSLIIIGEEMIDAFESVKKAITLDRNQKLVFLRDKGEKAVPKGYVDIAALVVNSPKTNPDTVSKVQMKDVIAYVFTSGTTGGMPKAAIITHKRGVGAMFFIGRIVNHISSKDTVYLPLPFFHTNALTLGWPPCIITGAAVAIRRKFSASNFLSDVRKFNATYFVYVGEVCRYIMSQPEYPDDHKNSLYGIIGNGLRPDIWKQFKKRFGIKRVCEIYGAAEGVGVFTNILNLDNTVGTSVTPFAIVEYDVTDDVILRDKDGFMKRVPTGGTGLLLMEISAKTEFAGYTNKEESNKKVLRDVFVKGDAWFNTGDLLRDIGYKHAQFVDRLGDTFRWKGENVSTTEVEKAANSFNGVLLSAVYGVALPGGDGRIGMVALQLEKGDGNYKLNRTALVDHFNKALPAYAVPRFVRIVKEFEYTATHKIKKFNLKEEGFDCEKIKDPLYVWLPGSSAYEPLTKIIYNKILSREYKM